MIHGFRLSSLLENPKHGNVHLVMKTGDEPVPCVLVVLLKRYFKFLVKIKIIIPFISLILISLKIYCRLRIHETAHSRIYTVAEELVLFQLIEFLPFSCGKLPFYFLLVCELDHRIGNAFVTAF